MTRRVILALAIVMGIGIGCDTADESASNPSAPARRSGATDKPVIAVIPKGTSHVFWQSVHAGANRAAKETGAEIRWQGPQSENERGQQIRIIDDMMIQGIDAMVLAPIDADALVDSVQNVHKKMPIVIFDSAVSTDQYTAYVATDNYRGGQLAGEQMLKLLGDAGGDIAIIRVMAGSASTTQREEGFKSVIASNPKVRVVAEPYGESNRDTSQRVTADVLQAHPNLAGIFGPNESSTFGALGAIQDAKKAGSLKFVGFDSSPELVAALDAGTIHALVLQNPVQMGYLSVKAAVAATRGDEKVTKEQPIEPTLVTQDNKDQPPIRELLEPKLDEDLP